MRMESAFPSATTGPVRGPQPSPSALLRRAEERLPRYTSYPTAPQFSPSVDRAVYDDWLSALRSGGSASVYLHVPFCRSMCWYCGCHTTIAARDEPIEQYLASLRREIDLIAPRLPSDLAIEFVHLGGGTPTIMGADRFALLMQRLRGALSVSGRAEIAIEIDPRVLTEDMVAALAAGGVSRASLGVQSFDIAVQRAINREQTLAQTADAVDWLRAAGIGRVNFDLIYGLPGQTTQSCLDTVASALTLRPDRLAVFGYAHVPEFKKHQRLIDESALPQTAERIEQAQAIAAALQAAGYIQIGLDHFALPDDELTRAQARGRLHRNFQGYTTDPCETLIGLGASAIGRTSQGYVQNDVPIGRYSDAIASGRLATVRGYRLTAEDRLRAEIIERLMCDFEANIEAIAARHGADPASLTSDNEALAGLMNEGIAEVDGGWVRVRAANRSLVRSVASAFDAYLSASPRRHSKVA